MKAVSVLLAMSLSPCAYGFFALDTHMTGVHTLQGLGTWQDKEGSQGGYMVQMQVQHLNADQALVTTTYIVQNKTYAITGVLSKNQKNASFFDVSAGGQKTGEGYCYAAPQIGDNAFACHVECSHNQTKFEGTLLGYGNKVERMGSLVLPSGKKLILRDTSTLVPQASDFGFERGDAGLKGGMGGDLPQQPAGDDGQADNPMADDQLDDITQQGPQDSQQGKGKGMGPIAPYADQPMDLGPAGKGPIVQGPIPQGPIPQGPIAQGPIPQDQPVQDPMVKGGGKGAVPGPGGNPGQPGDDDTGENGGNGERRVRAEMRSTRKPVIAESERAQIRRQLAAQQAYLRGRAAYHR